MIGEIEGNYLIYRVYDSVKMRKEVEVLCIPDRIKGNISSFSFVPISLFLLSFSAFLAYNLLISNKSYNFAVEFQKSGK